MPAVKTPGVYVEEISLLPPSVAEVATAIPAFIGYTDFAKDANDKLLENLPVKITSLLEFTSLYGGAYPVKDFTVKVDTGAGNQIKSALADKRFFLYDAIRQYFDNGGGECYIVSVGKFSDAIEFARLSAGIEAIRKFDEPTLIIFPEGVLLNDGANPDPSKLSDLHKQALQQCFDLKDRFTVMDIMQGDLREDNANKPYSNFRDNLGVNFLSYGAAYYPWVVTNYPVDLSFRQLKFVDAADAPIANTDVFSSAEELPMVNELKTTMGDTDIVIKDVGKDVSAPGLDSNKLLVQDNYLQAYLSGLESEVRKSGAFKQKLTDYLQTLATTAQRFGKTETDLPATSPVKLELPGLKKDTKLVDALKALVALEKNNDVLGNTMNTRDMAAIQGIYTALDAGTWFGAGNTFATIGATADAYPASRDSALRIIGEVKQKVLGPLLASFNSLLNAAKFYEGNATQKLFTEHPFYRGVSDKIKETMRTIPPSGAVAGIYAMVDRTRGVWKAPANVSIASIIGPAVKIDNREQDGLNVHPTGKSINAIRAFTGKGTLVWGARTLAGNDNEWRYIPVRRFFNMVEESVKKASEPFVFEPNDANTWVKVKVMIENFLTLQWRAGALQGAKPEDAFFVNVGLGETMTPDDIFNGRMIVEIGMAVVRPAEFIILRFSHKMMER